MTIFEAIILGVVQGITEFLPISSSGHLILAESLLGLHVEELVGFDIVVHVGTLIAILTYFWRDVKDVLSAFFTRDWQSPDGKLAWQLIIGTLPVVFVGFLWGDFISENFRSAGSVGALMILVGLYFLMAEYVANSHAPKFRLLTPLSKLWLRISGNIPKFGYKQAVLVGIAQCFALLPGVSRSGSTIATAMMLGLDRVKAARFSFLLGSVAITGAGTLLAFDLNTTGSIRTNVLLAGFFTSIIASYCTIVFLMRFLKENSLHVFAIYLLILGVTVAAISS